jgi:hypothetical protein
MPHKHLTLAIVLTILLFRCNVEDKTKFKLLKSVNENLQRAEKKSYRTRESASLLWKYTARFFEI